MSNVAEAVGTWIFSAIGAEATGATVIAGTVTVAEVVGEIVVVAASVALTELTQSGAPRGLGPDAQKANIRQDIAPRRKYYGTVKVGGVYDFLQVADGKLYIILLLGEGEFDSFVEHWLGDAQVTLDGTGFVQEAPFRQPEDGYSRVQILPQTGTATQDARAQMIAAWAGVWTSEHRLRGIANTLLIMQTVAAERFAKIYPSGVPVYRAVVNTAKVWDPRDGAQSADDPSTWTFTTNAARILLDHGWRDYGRGIPREMFELAIDDWIDKIEACDRLVALKNGGQEPRFQLSGGYGLDETAKAVARKMEGAVGARLRMRADGAAVLDLPIWEPPTVTITGDQILSYSGLRRGIEPGDMKNEIRAQFLSPSNGYEIQEADPWRDDDSIALNGVQSAMLDNSWSPSHRQSRQRQKTEAARLNPEWVGSITTNAYGLNVIGERWVNIHLDDLDIVITAEITAWSYNWQNATCLIGFRSITPDAFSLSLDEQGNAPGIADDSTSDAVESPDNLTVSTPVADFGNGVLAAFMSGSVDAPARDDLVLSLDWRVHDSGVSDEDAVWTPFSVASGAYEGTTGALPVDTYDVRARFTASNGATSSYVYVRSVAVTNSGSVVSATNVSFSAGNFTGSASMTWTVQSGDVDAFRYSIVNKVMRVSLVLETTTVGGTADRYLQVAIPAGKTALGITRATYSYNEGSAWKVGQVSVVDGGSVIRLEREDGSNWSLTTNTTYVSLTFDFDIN